MVAKDTKASSERPGDIAAATPRPGDIAAQTPRPGEIYARRRRPGDIAADALRPGDIAACQNLPGRRAYPHPLCGNMPPPVTDTKTNTTEEKNQLPLNKSLSEMTDAELARIVAQTEEALKSISGGNGGSIILSRNDVDINSLATAIGGNISRSVKSR